MGRRKVQKPEKQICQKCKEEKSLGFFYTTNSKMFPSGRVGICNTCVRAMIDINNVNSLKEVLRLIDKPFINHLWESALKKEDPLHEYFKNISSLLQYKGLTWKDGTEGSKGKEKNLEVRQDFSNDNIKEVSDELYRKWGRGFEPDEILDFEDLYNEWIDSYKIQTPMHESFLKMAIIYNVKATRAVANGNISEAEKYQKMFKDATSGGKLQPQQMSRADLGDSIDSFSQLVKKIEMSVDVIPILPRFLEKPKDKVDVCLWAFVNYVRNLKGLPDIEYKEMFKWYEDRKADYEKNMTDNIMNKIDDGGGD